MMQQKAMLLGLCWHGAGRTMENMPLLNMIAMCGSKPPTVISTCNYSGGKKMQNLLCHFFRKN